jgi:hypothetical protein
MSIKNYGAGTSGYLDPEGRNWETAVNQASKPILDKELNLIQDAGQEAQRTLRRKTFPSGWISENFLNSSASDLLVVPGSPLSNQLITPLLWANVNGWIVRVSNTNLNTGLNSIVLSAGPSGAGAKRTDFVFLEVWRRLIPAAPTTTGKSGAGRIWRDGNVKIASADDLTLNYADDILDGAVGTETTKRVQIQYRLRVYNGVDLFTYAFGMNDPAVVANSVPVTAAAPNGVATAYAYTNQSAAGDPGLWRAGDGNPANTLGTVDGYMYAIPLCSIFRRNTTAFNRLTNHNGGVAYPGPSDRPDDFFQDIIEPRDLLDMREGVSPSGWDLPEVVQKNMNFLFDNVNQTEIGAAVNGGGVHGHTTLWADEIGISNANGGDGTTNGDTPGAEFIGEFDAVRRSFSDRPIYEVVTLAFNPNDAGVSPGGATWTVGTTIAITPSALPIWPYASFNWAASAPSEVSIVDVLRTVWSSSVAGKKTFRAQGNFRISGLGSVPQGTVTARIESLTDGTNTATNETLYVTVMIAYPPGVGLTKTPTTTYADGVQVNNPVQLPTSSPILYDQHFVNYNVSNREVRLEYQTLSHTFSLRAGAGTGNNIFWLPERAVTVSSITIDGSPYGGSITVNEFGATVTPGAVTGGELVVVTYQSVRALPKNGEQFTIYYEARMPQTIREGLLPTGLSLTPRYVSQTMYAITAGSGSNAPAYPFSSAYVQAGAVYPSSSGSFGGDHELDGDLRVSTTTLFADTGFMQLPIHIPIVPTDGIGLQRSPGDVDPEGRSYYPATNNNYYMIGVGPTMSDPKKHKNLVPILCELPADSTIGFKGQLVLALVSRWAVFDDTNSVSFTNNSITNTTVASLYRLKGNLLAPSR